MFFQHALPRSLSEPASSGLSSSITTCNRNIESLNLALAGQLPIQDLPLRH